MLGYDKRVQFQRIIFLTFLLKRFTVLSFARGATQPRAGPVPAALSLECFHLLFVLRASATGFLHLNVHSTDAVSPDPLLQLCLCWPSYLDKMHRTQYNSAGHWFPSAQS